MNPSNTPSQRVGENKSEERKVLTKGCTAAKGNIHIIHAAFNSKEQTAKSINSYIELIGRQSKSQRVSASILVDGGGDIGTEITDLINLKRSLVSLETFEENIGNSQLTRDTLQKFIDRIDRSLPCHPDDWIIFNEDDNRCYRHAFRRKNYLESLRMRSLGALVSSDRKNKFSQEELGIIEECTGKEVHIRNWAAFGGTHLRRRVYERVMEGIIKASKTNLAANGLFFDKLLYASLNNISPREIDCRFISDKSMGPIATSRLIYPVVHGIKSQ
jgi:hypothetical protein